MILQQQFAITSAPAVSYLVNEDFEGTGTPSNWFRGGSADFDYTAAPLAGSQSLRLDAATGDYGLYSSGGALGGLSEVWVKMLFKPVTLPSSTQKMFTLGEIFTADALFVYVNSSGTLLVSDSLGANIYTSTVDAMSAGTTYNIWIHYKAGSGSNAICEVSFDVAGNSRPSGGNKWAGGTNGVSTNAAVNSFKLDVSGGGAIYVFDNVQVADTDVF